ncbi:shootin-1 isoform X2 [Aplysia californica]|uniref:Shootin-1 isoform X2 n=1 Tax=Aplysia californica TaxID=6500 RepID=A0ABM0JDD1_APLCA|nr:shootin-1 isoform X2 [Aplysia californica]
MSTDTEKKWKDKCHELEQIIKTLSTHCFKVVEKHEELLVNYKKNQTQYEELVTKYKDRGEQIKKAKDVLGPVSMEYKALREKYESAIRCQYEAENYATKINSRNKVLKRQSQMLLDKMTGPSLVDINIDDDATESAEENEYIKKLNQQIFELEDVKSSLSVQMKELNEDYHNEKAQTAQLRAKIEVYKQELQQTKVALGRQEKTLQLLAQTSEAAVEEHASLQDHFEKEILERNTALKLAQNLYAEREAARRQSAMLMAPVAGDKRLMEALIQVEELTTSLEKLKAESEQQVNALKEELTAVKGEASLQELEAENAQLTTECDSLQQRLVTAEKSTEELHSQYSSLLDKYADLEKKYETALTAPPPPPPPPPPPLPTAKTGGFLSKITGRKKQKELVQKRLGLGGAEVNANYTAAVDDMMKRIKDGNIALRPVLKKRTKSCPEDEDSSAMQELQGILSKMKKARSEDDLSAFDDDRTIDANSELGQVFKKIQGKQEGNRPRPAPRKLSTIKDTAEED